MSLPVPDPFVLKLRELLATLPPHLDAWQYAYRQLVVTMSSEFLMRFPEAFTGAPPVTNDDGTVLFAEKRTVGQPPPPVEPLGPSTGPGYHPSIIICKLGCLLATLETPPPCSGVDGI